MAVPNAENIIGVGNYVYSLLGAKLQLANQILSGGSGGIVPSPTPGGGTIFYYPINVTLTSGLITSQTITNSDWRALTQLSPTMTVNDTQFTLNTDYTYSVLNGSFTFISYNPQVNDVIATFGFKET